MISNTVTKYYDRLREVLDNLDQDPELLANYLLTSDELKEPKQEYTIFTDRKLFDRVISERACEEWKMEIFVEERSVSYRNADYHVAKYHDVKTIMTLLKMSPRSLRCHTDVEINDLIYDVNSILELLEINPRVLEILNYYRLDYTFEELGVMYECTAMGVYKAIERIAKKIVKAYVRSYDDYVYLNHLRGSYKRCSKCGQVRLVSEFDKSKNKCKGCR